MNILFDARPLTIPFPGGVTRLSASLLEAVASSLPQERCIFGTTGRRTPSLPITLPPNSRHTHLHAPNKVISTLTSLNLRSFDQLFAKERPDVLLLPNNGHVGIPSIPYGLVVHDLSFLVEPAWFRLRGRIWHKLVHAERIIKGASRVFAVSAWTKYALTLHLDIPEEKIDVLDIPCVGPAEPSGPLPKELRGVRYLLCLGGTDRRKNVSTAVEAVRSLHTKPAYTDVHLVIVGGYREALSDPRFVVLPRVNDATLYALYRDATAFLYPSWYEGLGLPLHEAALFHTPGIASCVTALPDTAPPETLFVPPSKPHLWAIALERLLEGRSTPPDRAHTVASSASANWETAIQPIRRFLLETGRR